MHRYLNINLIPLVLFVLGHVDLDAAEPYLVKDINGSGTSIEGGAMIGDRLVYTATGANGLELWISDGTVAGTGPIMAPGAATVPVNPSDYAAIAGGRVVFAAEDGVAGREPWITDGTSAGTRRLGAPAGFPQPIVRPPHNINHQRPVRYDLQFHPVLISGDTVVSEFCMIVDGTVMIRHWLTNYSGDMLMHLGDCVLELTDVEIGPLDR